LLDRTIAQPIRKLVKASLPGLTVTMLDPATVHAVEDVAR
jgi:hypothetical protein